MVSGEKEEKASGKEGEEEVLYSLGPMEEYLKGRMRMRMSKIPPSLRRYVSIILKELEMVSRYAQFRLFGTNFTMEFGFENNMPYLKIKVIIPELKNSKLKLGKI